MKPSSDYFRGRTAVIANKHQKERVIAPLLEQHLGLKIIVPTSINTDQFGTFTLDVHRQGTMLDAARAKALEGMRLTGADIGIASEGSFGPHPEFPLAPANTEIVIFIDTQNDVEIVGGSISLNSNHRHQYVESVKEAIAFAKSIGFPEHALVVRADEHNTTHMEKGITTLAGLEETVRHLLQQPSLNKVFLETDMRAHLNPTRMDNIKLATEDLIQNALRMCPKCGTPGLSIIKKEPGLPCQQCGLRTDLPLANVFQCKKCAYIHKELYPEKKKAAEPVHCGYCNP